MNESEKMIALQVEQVTKDLMNGASVSGRLSCAQDSVKEMAASINIEISESFKTSLAKFISTVGVDVSAELRRISPEILNKIQENAEISVEDARAVVEEVKPYLPPEVTESVKTKIEKTKTQDNKLSWSDWIAIAGVIVTILLFIAGQVSSDEHDQNEESFWSASAQYQQESLDLQKREAEHSEEFRQRAEEHFEITEEIYERIAQALETLADQSIESDQESQKLADLVDLPDDSPEEKALNETGDTED